MKDVNHHLRHIQKKVIRTTRVAAEEQSAVKPLLNGDHAPKEVVLSDNRASTNHRAPRLPNRSQVH